MKKSIPYSVRELELASSQPSDEYHRQLMRWAARRIHTLEDRLYGLVDDIYPHTVDRDVKAGETIPVRISKPFMVRE